MKVLVKDLVETCDYNLDYFFKLLRKNGVSNRIVLERKDICKLLKGLQAVNNKSYMLLIELNKIISSESKKAIK